MTLELPAASGSPYFIALDGIRGYCILLVLFNHLKSNGHTIAWLDGHLGVDIFFILSGFLITTLLAREYETDRTVDLRAFWWRRFFRLAPAYFAVLLLYIAIAHTHRQARKWPPFRADLPYFFTLLNEYAHGTTFTQTWSLGVEEKFYILWPVLAFVLARTLRARSLILTSLFFLCAIPPLAAHTYLARAYFGLLMGCLLALIYSSPQKNYLRALLARVPPLAVLLLFLVGMYAERFNSIFFPLFSLTTTCLIAHLVLIPSWLARAHGWSPLVWLGRRSYGMYLLHILSYNVIETRLHADSAAIATLMYISGLALTSIAAEVLYRIIEQPARTLGRLWLMKHHERSTSLQPHF